MHHQHHHHHLVPRIQFLPLLLLLSMSLNTVHGSSSLKKFPNYRNNTTCDFCGQALGQLTGFFLEEAELASEIMILQLALCPLTPAPPACQEQLALWWPDLALAITEYPELIPGICGEIPDLCSQDWGCDVCKVRVVEVAGIAESPEHLLSLTLSLIHI